MRLLLFAIALAACRHAPAPAPNPSPVTNATSTPEPREEVAPLPGPDPRCRANVKKVRPIETQIVDVEAWRDADRGATITIRLGTDDGIGADWGGTVVDGDGAPIPGGEFCIVRIRDRSAIANVALSVATVEQNLQVRLVPP